MTYPVGISNDVMAARPGDAYLAHVLPRLRHWNRWLGIKYIQVGGGAPARALIPSSVLVPLRACPATSQGSTITRPPWLLPFFTSTWCVTACRGCACLFACVQESFSTEEQGWVIRDGVVVIIKDSNIPDGTII